MPAGWDEFSADELAYALAESRGRADDLLTLALRLAARLPGTVAALRGGMITGGKAEIIAWATALLDPDEARAAEALVLGRAGQAPAAGRTAAADRGDPRHRPGRPGSGSKYTQSLPNQGISRPPDT
jgi:hypothetical protein